MNVTSVSVGDTARFTGVLGGDPRIDALWRGVTGTIVKVAFVNDGGYCYTRYTIRFSGGSEITMIDGEFEKFS